MNRDCELTVNVREFHLAGHHLSSCEFILYTIVFAVAYILSCFVDEQAKHHDDLIMTVINEADAFNPTAQHGDKVALKGNLKDADGKVIAEYEDLEVEVHAKMWEGQLYFRIMWDQLTPQERTGWKVGLQGMTQGTTRTLCIPPHIAASYDEGKLDFGLAKSHYLLG